MGSSENQRAGDEIVYRAEDCYRHSVELLEELGFPRGVLPLKDLEECGRVRETRFVRMKPKAPYEHFFVGSNTRNRCSRGCNTEECEDRPYSTKLLKPTHGIPASPRSPVANCPPGLVGAPTSTLPPFPGVAASVLGSEASAAASYDSDTG